MDDGFEGLVYLLVIVFFWIVPLVRTVVGRVMKLPRPVEPSVPRKEKTPSPPLPEVSEELEVLPPPALPEVRRPVSEPVPALPMFQDLGDLQRGVVWFEVLGRPVSERIPAGGGHL